MSVRNKLKQFAPAFIVLFVAVNVGVFTYNHFQKISSDKKIKPPLRLSSFADGGPAQKLFNIKLDYTPADNDQNQVVEITAKIKVPFNYHFPVSYSWKLSPDVKLISGSLNGEISSGVSANEEVAVKIQVSGFTKTINRHIWFEAKSVAQGHALYSEVMAASDMENTFENVVQNVERIKAQE